MRAQLIRNHCPGERSDVFPEPDGGSECTARVLEQIVEERDEAGRRQHVLLVEGRDVSQVHLAHERQEAAFVGRPSGPIRDIGSAAQLRRSYGEVSVHHLDDITTPRPDRTVLLERHRVSDGAHAHLEAGHGDGEVVRTVASVAELTLVAPTPRPH